MSHIYFIGGIYGVGKSTLIQKMSSKFNYFQISASKIISEQNKEEYGANKLVKDKNKNQEILISGLDKIRNSTVNSILLAGHFCIIGKDEETIDDIPTFIFKKLYLNKIVILTLSTEQIVENLKIRDNKIYNKDFIHLLQEREEALGVKIAKMLRIEYMVYKMKFNNEDEESIHKFLSGDKHEK